MFKVESKKVIEYMLFLECDGGTVQHNLATQLTRAALLAVQSFRTRRRVGRRVSVVDQDGCMQDYC